MKSWVAISVQSFSKEVVDISNDEVGKEKLCKKW